MKWAFTETGKFRFKLMLKKIKADFHIHTCLSPCGDIQMTPNLIVEKAKSIGIDAICICDHNSSENVAAIKKTGVEKGLEVFCGMEVNSREEVHILAIFDSEKKYRAKGGTLGGIFLSDFTL